jgi:hypothetical protein
VNNPQEFDDHGASLPRSRWPDVIGIIGLVLSAIMFFDKLNDLVTLTWTEEQWSRFVGTDLADVIVRSLPPRGVRLVSSVVHMALAILLFTGSLALRGRRRSAVDKCRVWATLAIGWVAVEIGWAIWWLSRFTGEIMGVAQATWQGYAAFGIALALLILLAYPVFLLTWLSRSHVRAEYTGWPV